MLRLCGPGLGFRLGVPTLQPKFYSPQTQKYAYIAVVSVALAVVSAPLYALVMPPPSGFAYYDGEKWGRLTPVLEFARGHRDGRYLVENQPLSDPAGAGRLGPLAQAAAPRRLRVHPLGRGAVQLRWFDVALARSPESRLDRLEVPEGFGSVVVDAYGYDDAEGAYARLREVARSHHLVLLSADDHSSAGCVMR